MTALPRPWLAGLVLALACTGAGFYVGDRLRNAAWLQALADEREQAAAQLQGALAHLQAEQARGDALSTGLLTQQAQIDQLQEEAQRAITHQTTGRACLDGAALRVLGRAPGIAFVPAPTGGAAAEDGAAAGAADDAGDVYATDTQTARWAIDAAGQYETCRLRLDALIDWHTQTVSE